MISLHRSHLQFTFNVALVVFNIAETERVVFTAMQFTEDPSSCFVNIFFKVLMTFQVPSGYAVEVLNPSSRVLLVEVLHINLGMGLTPSTVHFKIAAILDVIVGICSTGSDLNTISKEGRNAFLNRFHQFRSYRGETDTRNQAEFPFSP